MDKIKTELYLIFATRIVYVTLLVIKINSSSHLLDS